MPNLCACLCNQAGHTGVCRGSAEPGLRLAPGQPSIVDGPVCRGCFEAVRPLSTRYGPARVQPRTPVQPNTQVQPSTSGQRWT